MGGVQQSDGDQRRRGEIGDLYRVDLPRDSGTSGATRIFLKRGNAGRPGRGHGADATSRRRGLDVRGDFAVCDLGRFREERNQLAGRADEEHRRLGVTPRALLVAHRYALRSDRAVGAEVRGQRSEDRGQKPNAEN